MEADFQTGILETYSALVIVHIIGNSIALKYIVKDLTVSRNIKRIMSTSAIFAIICSFLSITGIIIKYNFSISNSLTCGLMTDFLPLILIINILMAMKISILRNYMARTIADNRFINDKKVEKVIFSAFGAESFVFFIFIMSSLGFGSHLTLAASDCNPIGNAYLIPIIAIIFVSSISITFYHDLSLLFFVRDYNKKTKDQMEVWSFQSKNSKEELKDVIQTNIPILSSAISLFVGIMLVIIVLVAAFAVGFDGLEQFNVIAGSILNAVYVPIFTIIAILKQSEGKKAGIRMPSGLHFHEDLEEDEENIINDDFNNHEEYLENPKTGKIQGQILNVALLNEITSELEHT